MKCISKHRLVDEFYDCPINDDELYNDTCSLNLNSRFQRTIDKDRCISYILVKSSVWCCKSHNNEPDTSKKDTWNIALRIICDGKVDILPILIDNKNETDETDCNESPCRKPGITCQSDIDSFELYPSSKVLEVNKLAISLTKQSVMSSANLPVIRDNNRLRRLAWYCNREILIESIVDGEKCLCPPSYHGELCQYQSQRVSLTSLLRQRSAFEQYTTFKIVLLLMTHEENIVLSYEQVLFHRPHVSNNCAGLYKTQLLYPNRPKLLLNKAYFIRIDAYAIHSLRKQKNEYRASWYSEILMSSISVNKIALSLIIPEAISYSVNAMHDPWNRRLISDEEEQRTWCVISYTHRPWLNSMNMDLNISHFIIPFTINFLSVFIVILKAARKRSVSYRHKSYR
ncbi:unnamed protein product [Rotaria sp. Silwood1]|nr:unnamed protein product [Rotaria sp. Silwood1]